MFSWRMVVTKSRKRWSEQCPKNCPRIAAKSPCKDTFSTFLAIFACLSVFKFGNPVQCICLQQV